MAKSQLEIVLIDEGEAATQPTGPPAESVAAASASVPVRERAARTTDVEVAKPSTVERPHSKREDSSKTEPSQSRERHDTTAVDVAARVAQMTARAFNLGGLVGEIQHWQQLLREVAGLFKGAVSSAAPSLAAIARPVVTSAPDDRQSIKVEIPKPSEPSPVVPRAPATTVTAPRPDDSRGWQGLHFDRRPVAPTVRPTSVPWPAMPVAAPRAAPTAPLSGVAAWTSAAVPAARAASTAATAVPAATGATAAAGAATAAPAAGGATGLATVLGPIGLAAIAVTAAFAGLVLGTRKLSSYLSGEAQKLAGYSAQTAAATAESDIRREQAMMARATRVGPQMAQFERFRGRTEERLMNIGTEIQAILLRLWEKLEPAVDKSVSALEFGVAEIPVFEKMLEIYIDIQLGFLREAQRDFKDLVKLQSKANKELGQLVGILDEEKADPLTNDFLATFEGLGAGMAARLMRQAERPRRNARQPGGP